LTAALPQTMPVPASNSVVTATAGTCAPTTSLYTAPVLPY
jgi:hypothetical protein